MAEANENKEPMLELIQVVQNIEKSTVSRSTAIELLREHDPEGSGFEELSDQDLATMLAATANDYPDSALQAHLVDNSVGWDILDTTPWEGRVRKW